MCCQSGGDSGELGGHVKNYVVTSSGYRRRATATSSALQLNITNYNLPITVSYMNYLKQRKVSRSMSLFSCRFSTLADKYCLPAMLCYYWPLCVCLSVCLSHVGIVSKHGCTDWSVFLAYSFPSIYPTLYFMGIRLFPKIRVFFSGTLSQTLDFRKFGHVPRCQARYKQATVVGLLLTILGDDGRRGQVLFTSTDDCRQLITLDVVQLCVQNDGGLNVMQRRAGPSASSDTPVIY